MPILRIQSQGAGFQRAAPLAGLPCIAPGQRLRPDMRHIAARASARARAMPAAPARDGLAVLMTTHHPGHALLVADSAMLLHAGAMTGPMPPAALITPPRLRAAYGVDAVVGALATPQGARLVCAPLVDSPPAAPA